MNQKQLIELIKTSLEDANEALEMRYPEVAEVHIDYALKLIPFILQEEVAQELIGEVKETEVAIDEVTF